MNRTMILVILTSLLVGCTTAGKLESIRDKMDKLETIRDRIKDGLDRENKEEHPADELPFALEEVEWCAGDNPITDDWKQTLTITGMSLGGDSVSWTYKDNIGPDELGWKPSGRISCRPDACLAWVSEIGGKWRGVAACEWLPVNQTWQARKVFRSERGTDDDHDYKFHGALKMFEPTRGQVFYVAVVGLNWCGLANVRERSNFYRVEY